MVAGLHVDVKSRETKDTFLWPLAQAAAGVVVPETAHRMGMSKLQISWLAPNLAPVAP